MKRFALVGLVAGAGLGFSGVVLADTVQMTCSYTYKEAKKVIADIGSVEDCKEAAKDIVCEDDPGATFRTDFEIKRWRVKFFPPSVSTTTSVVSCN